MRNADGAAVTCAVRPEKMLLSEESPGEGYAAFRATVEKVAYFGNESRVFLTTDMDLPLEVSVVNASRDAAQHEPGSSMWVAWKPSDTLILGE